MSREEVGPVREVIGGDEGRNVGVVARVEGGVTEVEGGGEVGMGLGFGGGDHGEEEEKEREEEEGLRHVRVFLVLMLSVCECIYAWWCMGT